MNKFDTQVRDTYKNDATRLHPNWFQHFLGKLKEFDLEMVEYMAGEEGPHGEGDLKYIEAARQELDNRINKIILVDK